MPVRVLHVTESLGGGTAGALVEFVRSTPQYEHHLLARVRPGSERRVEYATLFASHHTVGGGVLRLAARLRPTLRATRPRIVHLHSTWAGLVGRVLRVDGAAVAYTPHCFAFERASLPAPARALARAVERLLAARTDLVIGVSPHETALADRLGAATALVPNTVRTPPVRRAPGRPPTVVTVGRVCPQKDVAFLLAVKRAVTRDARWVWVGGGDPAGEARLRAAGVHVTGWLDAAGTAERLADARVYLHTAAWESCPLAVLEALAAGLPVVARGIPALASIGLDPALDTVEAVAAEVDTVLATGLPSRPALQRACADRHTPRAQAAALAAAYATLEGAPCVSSSW